LVFIDKSINMDKSDLINQKGGQLARLSGMHNPGSTVVPSALLLFFFLMGLTSPA
jgi:hypothetical protein